jgi:putative transposase
MRDLVILFIHVIATLARVLGPGGIRSVVAESVLVKHQLLILNRSRKRSPNLRLSDRMVAGLCALLIRPRRLIGSAIVFRPSTLLRLHRALTARKYRLLFSANVQTKPGPKGPSQEVVAAVVDMKRRNPTWGCPRIAQQISLAFGIQRTGRTNIDSRADTQRLRPGTGSVCRRQARLNTDSTDCDPSANLRPAPGPSPSGE